VAQRPNSRRERGFTLGETLVAVGVLLLFAAIIVPLYLRERGKGYEEADIERLRKVYVAWSLYQADSQGGLPPSLYSIRWKLMDDAAYLSNADPFQKTKGAYPLEPMLPKNGESIPIRISFAYMNNFVRAGVIPKPNWSEVLTNPKIGILACAWQGKVTPSFQPFVARVDGPILRVNSDGSAFRLPERRHPDRMGDPSDLFFNRH